MIMETIRILTDVSGFKIFGKALFVSNVIQIKLYMALMFSNVVLNKNYQESFNIYAKFLKKFEETYDMTINCNSLIRQS